MLNLVALAVPVFFALIGVEVLVLRALRVRAYRFSDAITDLSCGIGQQVTGVFVKLLVVVPYAWVYDHLRVTTLADDAVGTHLLAFFAVDLAYYAWHRWTHEMNLGWTTHVVHHQSEDYNLAVALRQSVTSSLSSWPFQLPLALLGISPTVLLTHAALNTLYQFWIHTETIGRLGPLEWIFNTPSHHRVHHAINPQYIDRNYAGVLIVWDRMFRSFEPEGEAPMYGTVEPMRSFNPLWANVWYADLLVRDSFAARTWGEVGRVWFGRPGYRPAGLEPHPVPRSITREQQTKYAPRGVPGVAPYVVVHFVPVSIATTAMMWFEHTASALSLGVAMALVLATVAVWGGLFERKPWALPLEASRLAAAGAALTAFWWDHPLWIAAAWIGALASGAWLSWIVRRAARASP